MNDHQKIVLLAGAGAALFLLNKKKVGAAGARNPAAGVANRTATGTTNMATRGGTTTQPRVPSSGLGFPPATSAGARGAQPPSKPAAVAGAVTGTLKRLLDAFRPKPAPLPSRPTAPTSNAPKVQGGASPAGGSSGGSPAAPRSGAMGGSAGVANQYYSNGYFDGNGRWVGYDGYYDANGNFVLNDGSNVSDTQAGVFDDAGNFIPNTDANTFVGPQPDPYEPGGDQFVGPTYDAYQPGGSEFTGPIYQEPGAIDENGYYDPYAEPAAEVVASDDWWDMVPQSGGNDLPDLPTDPSLYASDDWYGDNQLDYGADYGTWDGGYAYDNANDYNAGGDAGNYGGLDYGYGDE